MSVLGAAPRSIALDAVPQPIAPVRRFTPGRHRGEPLRPLSFEVVASQIGSRVGVLAGAPFVSTRHSGERNGASRRRAAGGGGAMTDPFVIGEYEDRDRAQAALRAVASNGVPPGAVEIEHEIVVVKAGHARYTRTGIVLAGSVVGAIVGLLLALLLRVVLGFVISISATYLLVGAGVGAVIGAAFVLLIRALEADPDVHDRSRLSQVREERYRLRADPEYFGRIREKSPEPGKPSSDIAEGS
jgi:hypothetical protein